jgi:hypothetical protein
LTDTQVLIVGAGPVGLTLDLGLRGVRCTLIERNTTAFQLPKMERCNARTMEIYRRLGISERVRDAGLPRTAPMDVFLALSMAGSALAHLPYPCVAEAKAAIAVGPDFTLLRLGGTKAYTPRFEQAFQNLSAPLDVPEIQSKRAREIYDVDLVLVRPDLHVAWRGNKISNSDALKIVAVAAGSANSLA